MFPFTRLPISGTYFRPTPIEFCRHHLTSVSCLPRLPGFALEVHGAYGGPDAFMQRMCPEKSEPRLGPPHYLSYAPRTKHRESQWFHGRFFSSFFPRRAFFVHGLFAPTSGCGPRPVVSRPTLRIVRFGRANGGLS